jgi:hypothetical protein
MRETTDPTILGWEGQGIHENNGKEDQTHGRSRSGIQTEGTSEGNLVDTPTAQAVQGAYGLYPNSRPVCGEGMGIGPC